MYMQSLALWRECGGRKSSFSYCLWRANLSRGPLLVGFCLWNSGGQYVQYLPRWLLGRKDAVVTREL